MISIDICCSAGGFNYRSLTFGICEMVQLVLGDYRLRIL